MEDNEQAPQPQVSTPKFLFPGVSTILQCGENPVPVDRLVSIILHLAMAEPDCQVDFWIKVKGDA